MRKLPLQLLALAALTVPVSAQDMLAVDWTGQIYALDSYTGAIEAAGVGMFGQNCMARDENGDVWSIGQGSPVSFGFVSRSCRRPG